MKAMLLCRIFPIKNILMEFSIALLIKPLGKEEILVRIKFIGCSSKKFTLSAYS